MKPVIHVIGAGISGLSVAKILAENNFAVHVYDKTNRPGGLISTYKNEYGIAESAANSILVNQATIEFLNACKCPLVHPQKFARRRFLFNETPTRWPLNFTESLTFAIRVFLRVLGGGKKAFRPLPRETLQAWGNRVLGQKATTYILGPAMQGIYAGDLDQLSASLILGPVFKKNKKKYLGIVSGPNGMQDIIQAIYKACLEHNVHFHFNQTIPDGVLKDLQTNQVIIATSASEAGAVLETTHPKLAMQLSSIPMNSIVSSTHFFKHPGHEYQGFGCLIPRGFGISTLGVLLNSFIFPGRDKYHNETYIMGGATEGKVVNLDEGEINSLARAERSKIFGTSEAPIYSKVFYWKKALPHYTIELEQILENLVIPQGVYLHGNYLSGIGISKIIDRSNEIATDLIKRFNGASK